MADVTKQDLVEMEERIVSRLKAYIDERFEGQKACSDQRSEGLKAYINERSEKVETALLSEFWKWGRTSDMRTRQAITDTGLLGERVLAIEDRVSALERKAH